MKLQQIITVRNAAERHYLSGFCCSEAAFLALAEMQKIDSPLVPRMATAFCGGMAQTGGPCGAYTGAALGISMALGRSSAEEQRQAINTAVQRLVREFEETFGYRTCNELKGLTAFGVPKEGSERASSPCAAYTCKAAEIAACILLEHMEAVQAE